MVARRDCVSAIRSANEALSDDEALDILDTVQRRRERLEADGTIDRMDARLRKLAGEAASDAKIKAALQRKHAVLSMKARRRMADAVQLRMSHGLDYRQALLSVLEGDAKHRNSVAANILAHEARYLGGLMGRIAKEKPHIERRLGDRKLMDDATRLMFGDTVDNADPDARYLADLFGEYMELTRVEANAHGANIGKLAGYVPQAHVDWRLLGVKEGEWISTIKPLLDYEKTFPDVDPSKVDDILRGIYNTVTLGRDVDWKASGGFKGPSNFANALGQHRVLHFKNADSFLAYNQKFGYGDLFTVMTSHLRRMSRTNAIMDKMGPNPGSTLDNLLDTLIERAQRDPNLSQEKRAKTVKMLEAAQTGAETGRGGSIGAAYRVVSGIADVPGDWTAAKAGQSFRSAQSLSKLGGATLTAVPTDLATLAMNISYQGKNGWAALGTSFRHVLKGRGKGEDRTVAYLGGEGFDGIVGHLTSRYGDLDTLPGRMSKLMTFFFRINGLSGWTDVARAAGARMMAADMGRLADKGWDALPDSYRRVLGVHEIDAAQWDAIRATAWKSPDTGRRYVTADRIEDRDLALALSRFYADEGVQNVVEIDASTKRWATFGSRPGTLGGEAVRTVFQFKGFPLAFTRRILGRAIYGPGSKKQKAWHGAKLISTLAIAGYLSQVAKDASRGLEPKDPTEPATILQALLQSGAAGVYGDFLFNVGGSRFGNTALETAGGPTLTTLADIVNLYQAGVAGEATGKEAFDSIWQNVPFQNLWYARTAMDMLVLNELREALSPGYMRRRERFTREAYGQESVIPMSAYR